MRQKREDIVKKDLEIIEKFQCKQPPKSSRIREQFARMRAHISQRFAKDLAKLFAKKEEAV